MHTQKITALWVLIPNFWYRSRLMELKISKTNPRRRVQHRRIGRCEFPWCV